VTWPLEVVQVEC